MASPDEVMDGILRSVEDAGVLPEQSDMLKYEADQVGENSDLKLPLVQVQPITVEYLNPHNTSRTSYKYDTDGNRIGKVFHAEYELVAEVRLWVAARSKWDVDELGNKVRRVLYQHDSDSLNIPLPNEDYEYVVQNEDGELIRPDDVWWFSLESSERADETTQSPTLRRWRYDFSVHSYEIFETEESYIEEVTTPIP